MKRCCSFLACLAAVLAGVASAGPDRRGHQPQPPRADRSTETARAHPMPPASLDDVIAALYDGVSGDADEPRDWEAFSRLFVPGARLTVTRADAAEGIATDGLAGDVLDVARFAALNDRLFKGRGFHERELHRETSHYGGIAHVWSVYESRRTREGDPYARGANSLQLLRTRDGWRIVSVTWDQETPAQPLPQRFPAVAARRLLAPSPVSGGSENPTPEHAR